MVNKISGLGQNPMTPQNPQEPAKKAKDKPITIMKGMTVADVKKYGSEAQKLVANLFDNDIAETADGEWYRDGIYTEGEAAYFDNHDFTLTDNVFTMYDRKYGQTIEIKYSNIDDLKSMFNDAYSEPTTLFFDKDGKNQLYLGNMTQGGKITLDLDAKTITADGVKGDLLAASGDKVTVKNSDLGEISSSGAELEIENTRNARRILRDKATKVSVDIETNVKVDDESKVNIERE